MLSDQAIRASWEAARDDIRRFLLTEKKFNPKSVERFIDNFIASMVFAKLPCRSLKGLGAACERYVHEQRVPVSRREFLRG